MMLECRSASMVSEPLISSAVPSSYTEEEALMLKIWKDGCATMKQQQKEFFEDLRKELKIRFQLLLVTTNKGNISQQFFHSEFNYDGVGMRDHISYQRDFPHRYWSEEIRQPAIYHHYQDIDEEEMRRRSRWDGNFSRSDGMPTFFQENLRSARSDARSLYRDQFSQRFEDRQAYIHHPFNLTSDFHLNSGSQCPSPQNLHQTSNQQILRSSYHQQTHRQPSAFTMELFRSSSGIHLEVEKQKKKLRSASPSFFRKEKVVNSVPVSKSQIATDLLGGVEEVVVHKFEPISIINHDIEEEKFYERCSKKRNRRFVPSRSANKLFWRRYIRNELEEEIYSKEISDEEDYEANDVDSYDEEEWMHDYSTEVRTRTSDVHWLRIQKNLKTKLETEDDKVSAVGCIELSKLDDEMSKRSSCGVDSVTYGILLKGLGKARRIDEAFQILESMEQGGAAGNPKLSPRLIYGLLNSLLEAGDMCHANGLVARYRLMLHGDSHSILLCNLLMNGYTNTDFPLGALTVRDEIMRQGLKLDKLTYNTLIFACVESVKIDTTNQFLVEMKEEALKSKYNDLLPDAVTYTTLLKGLRNKKDLLTVQKIVVEMKSQIDLCIDRTAYTAMIDAFLACGSVEGALCIYGEMIKQAGINKKLMPKPHIYLSMMRVFATRGDFDMVNKLHEHMWLDSVGSISPSARLEADELIMEAAINNNQTDVARRILSKIVTKESDFTWTSRGGMVVVRLEALLENASSLFTPYIPSQVSLDDPIDKYMFLTYKDEVAEHDKWSRHFSCERILHSGHVEFSTSGVEKQLFRNGPWIISTDFEFIHAPGDLQRPPPEPPPALRKFSSESLNKSVGDNESTKTRRSSLQTEPDNDHLPQKEKFLTITVFLARSRGEIVFNGGDLIRTYPREAPELPPEAAASY